MEFLDYSPVQQIIIIILFFGVGMLIWVTHERYKRLLAVEYFLMHADEMLEGLQDKCILPDGKTDIHSIGVFTTIYLEAARQICRDCALPLPEITYYFNINEDEVRLYVKCGDSERTWNWTPKNCQLTYFPMDVSLEWPAVDFPLTPVKLGGIS